MPEEVLCPNCNQAIESGALYCGNCGFKLIQGKVVPQTREAVPSYAIPATHHKQHWAAMALAFAALAIGGGLIAPILGVVFSMTAIVLATSSYRITHGWLRPASILVSAAALLLSVGIWVNTAVNNVKLTSANSQTANGVTTISVTTPCYSLSFNTELNVNNTNGSCSLNAYNNTTFQSSSNVFKVVASQQSSLNLSNFDSLAKQAIAADLSKNLPDFNIAGEAPSIFGGSPAYYIKAYNSSTNVSVIEESIFHTTSKDNYFVIVHAVNDSSVNLNSLEVSWQWNSK